MENKYEVKQDHVISLSHDDLTRIANILTMQYIELMNGRTSTDIHSYAKWLIGMSQIFEDLIEKVEEEMSE